MNGRRTFGDVKTIIAKVIGVCDTDPLVAELTNQAQEVLISRGRWVGTYQRYRICADRKGCITWPRQIQTIEAWAMWQGSGIIRNQWYEFLPNGPGLVDKNDEVGMTMLDRGEACTFEDINNLSSVIRVYADVAEDAGAQILLQGYDENGNWIRTETSPGNWIDGELVLISTTPTNSENIFSSLVAVQKPVTNGTVRIYQYNIATTLQRALAFYEPDETRPQYRRSQIPNLQAQCGGSSCTPCGSSSSSSSSTCEKKTITVMAKLAFIPVAVDRDWMLISNIAALKLMVKAIVKRDQNLLTDAELYEAKAIGELQKELSVYEGDGAVPIPRMQDRFSWGAGGVMNILG